MIGSSKNKRENYPRKCFWTEEKETRVKFNPGLSANRPSNNWAPDEFADKLIEYMQPVTKASARIVPAERTFLPC